MISTVMKLLRPVWRIVLVGKLAMISGNLFDISKRYRSKTRNSDAG